MTQTLREVKQVIRDADYCDFSEGITDECLRVFDDIRLRNKSTDQETATKLANQMKCLSAGFAAGLNPQEINGLQDKLDGLRRLVEQGLLINQEDDNKLISAYLSTYGEQLRFRK